MASYQLIELNEDDIRALSTAPTFGRGRKLFKAEVLEKLSQRGAIISAIYREDGEATYKFTATLGFSRITSYHCSCGFKNPGLCAHLVALLLTYVHTPQRFAENVKVQPKGRNALLLRELQTQKSQDLAKIVVKLVEAEPHLLPLVEQMLSRPLSQIMLDKTRQSITKKIARLEPGPYSSDASQLRRDIKLSLKEARALASVNPGEGGRLYTAILGGVTDSQLEVFFWDECDFLGDVVQTCVTALIDLLPAASPQRRTEWLLSLCEACLVDIRIGGWGFAEGTDDALLDADPANWKLIERRLDECRSAIDAVGENGFYANTHWQRECIVALKAARLQEQGGVRASARPRCTLDTTK